MHSGAHGDDGSGAVKELGADARRVLGKRVQAWRNLRGVSQTGLSFAAGVSVDVIRSCEGGRSLPSIFNLLKMARALEVTVERLVTDDPPQPKATGRRHDAGGR